MPVAAAIGISGVAGAAANFVGGQKQADAATTAANLEKQQYEQTRTDLQPFTLAGTAAANQLVQRLPDLTAPIVMDEATLRNTPGYQFNLNQGLKSAQNGAAVRGLGSSGAAIKGAETYATGLADSTFQNQFSNANTNKLNAYNFLLGTSQLGANAGAQAGQIGQAGAAAAGGSLTDAGTAQAAGLTGAANALTNAANSYAGYKNPFKNPFLMTPGLYSKAA